MGQQPERIGKYEVRGMLGQGGMGTVMLAWDADLQREVALKLVMPYRLRIARARERFVREARALARLSDPHVVQVFAFEPEADPPYLVMERLIGEDLRDVAERVGHLPPALIRDCAWQCTRGLAAAHAVGIVHRDIKPSNIMLSTGGVYKLLDFGLAASHDGDLTASGEVVGSRRFIAPERMTGGEAVPASDLWSLAVVLCELATGRHPFANGTALDLQALPAGHSAEFQAWIRRLLEPDPTRRFADAGAALIALGGSQTGVTAALAAQLHVQHTESTGTLPHSTSGSRPVITSTRRPMVVAPTTARLLRQPHLPFWLKLTATIWLMASLGAVAAGWAITDRAMAAQFSSLRQHLIGIAAGGAQLVDGELHARMADDPAVESAAIADLRRRLNAYRVAFPEVRYIYTMAQLPETAVSGVVQFVCDASDEVDRDGDGVIGPDEARAAPGQRYPTRSAPELLAGFAGPSVDTAITHDQWGDWLSGYAPIRRSDGTSAGLLGVDLPAGDITALRHDFLVHSAILLGSTLLAFLAAGLLIAWRMRRPVSELTRGMQAVAAGDLSVEIAVQSRDEFGLLAEAFRGMRDELRKASALRSSFDAFVARTLSDRDGRSGHAVTEGARLALIIQGSADAMLAALLEAARQHGGAPERVEAGGMIMLFPSSHPDDQPQERALRAALGVLAGALGARCACGIAVGGVASSARALALARAGLRTGCDLLVDPPAFTAISAGFYADLIHERDDIDHRVLDEAWAVKGAVSSRTP
jgi:eukaryotic-like serine/threonine-protein kinase